MTIGKRLKQTRIGAELSQIELAQKSGVSQQMISRLEAGKARRTKDIVPLALSLGVSPEWLATGEGPRPPTKPVSSRTIRMGEKFAKLSPPRQDLILRLIDELA